MNAKSMKLKLESIGCVFHKVENVWYCSLDDEVVSRDRFLGDLIWKAAEALGEEK